MRVEGLGIKVKGLGFRLKNPCQKLKIELGCVCKDKAHKGASQQEGPKGLWGCIGVVPGFWGVDVMDSIYRIIRNPKT